MSNFNGRRIGTVAEIYGANCTIGLDELYRLRIIINGEFPIRCSRNTVQIISECKLHDEPDKIKKFDIFTFVDNSPIVLGHYPWTDEAIEANRKGVAEMKRLDDLLEKMSNNK